MFELNLDDVVINCMNKDGEYSIVIFAVKSIDCDSESIELVKVDEFKNEQWLTNEHKKYSRAIIAAKNKTIIPIKGKIVFYASNIQQAL
ncbi:hypothetical protein D3C73_816070 [compost metagenome]